MVKQLLLLKKIKTETYIYRFKYIIIWRWYYMNIKQIVDKMFLDIVQDYENEKMMKNGGFVCRTTSKVFLKKLNRSGLYD